MKQRVRMSRAIAWVLSLSSIVSYGLALDPKQELSHYRIETWREPEGLKQDSVRALAQTKDGYLWVGTNDGLLRFDGVRFTTFSVDTGSLKDNEVWALKADREGGLWIATFGGGVVHYRDGRFTALTAANGLPDNYIWNLDIDTRGDLWISGIQSVSRYSNGRFTTFTHGEGESRDHLVFACAGPHGEVYANSVRRVYRYVDGRFKEEPKVVIDQEQISYMCASPVDGSLWIGLNNGVLKRLKDGEVTSYTGARSPSNYIFVTYVDPEGTPWVGSGDGIRRLRNGKFEQLHHGINVAPPRGIRALFSDREGSLWIGTLADGLARLKNSKLVSLTSDEGLPDDYVRPVYEDSRGILWVGTVGGLTQYSGGKFTAVYDRSGEPIRFVASLSEDTNGGIWVAAGGRLFIARHGRVEEAPFWKRTDSEIRVVYRDRRGRMWVGTNGDGLFLIDDGRVSVFRTRDGLTSDAIRVLHEDRQGILWIGTLGGGLCRYQDGKFTGYSTADGLAGMHVLDVIEDSEGTLWLATRNGLSRLKNGRFFNYRPKDGLGANFIYRIINDRDKDFWFSCANGIFRVSKAQLNAYAEGKAHSITSWLFGTKDGMRTTACTPGVYPAGWRRSDGTIVFSTYKGMTIVDPKSLVLNKTVPLVYVEQVLINGQEVSLRKDAEVGPGTGRLEIHYTGLSYLAPEKVRFKFMLEGFDKDWIVSETRRAAYYTNLPPGRYRFRVIACNDDGQWNQTGASFAFRLKPHFYQSYWFYALTGVVLALFGLSLHQIRVRQVVARQAAVLNERLRMSREIHDTLGQGFAAISAQLEIASAKIDICREEAVSHLELAKKFAADCFEEARWLIRSLRDLSLKKTNLAETLRKNLKEFTDGADCEGQFNVAGSPIPLLEEVESNLLRIGQEAINNAINHGHAKHICVSIAFEPRRVTLRVTDDGSGFDPSQVNHEDGLHLGLIGMRERANQIRGTISIESAPGVGANIVIHVPVS